MRYIKPALSFEQQAQRLIDRGLIVKDKSDLIKHLSGVNYYRLSAYWYPYKQIDTKTGEEYFLPNTDFEKIWRRYVFDRKLRLLIMDAVERVEVAILRTQMVEQFTLLYGPFGYTNIKNFSPKFSQHEHTRLLSEIDLSIDRSKEEFIYRFKNKYTNESHLPLWIAAEVLTFGHLFTFYRNLNRKEQQTLANSYSLYPPVLETWLHSLNFIRNACAHHARLWNRVLPVRPQIPDARHNPEWHSPTELDNRHIFVILTLLQHLLKNIEPNNFWKSHLEQLLREYPEVPIQLMGFPENWFDSSIWK